MDAVVLSTQNGATTIIGNYLKCNVNDSYQFKNFFRFVGGGDTATCAATWVCVYIL